MCPDAGEYINEHVLSPSVEGESAVGQSDPYQRWSGAPKHWVEIPAQRQGPPPTLRTPAPARARPPRRREAVVVGLAAAVTIAVTVAVVVLTGPDTSVARLDGPGPGAVTRP